MCLGRQLLNRGLADARGVSVARVALAWLLHQPQVASVIVGAKRPRQLADNLAATGVVPSAAELEQIDSASRLPPEYPGWMLEHQGAFRRNQIAQALAPRTAG